MTEPGKNKILVAGLINIETTLRIPQFPIGYFPVYYPFFGIRSTVSGVGYNIALALTTLGDRVRFLSIVGDDYPGRLVHETIRSIGLPGENILDLLEHTCQSVILYDGEGKRQIHTDLKNIQDIAYPAEFFDQALAESDVVVLCNINFTRPYLKKARLAGKLVATDVHAISDLEDEYNREYMEAADILFMSDERLPCSPEEWSIRVMDRYGAEIVVIGLGAKGALLAVRSEKMIERVPAVTLRTVVNTIGAGDALFSAFLHCYVGENDALLALKKAVVFAGYKTGVSGAADGFVDDSTLEAMYYRTLRK